MLVTVIDNYDSFVYNLVAMLRDHSVEVEVQRNRHINFDRMLQSDAVLLSPGPGIPEEAGDLMKALAMLDNHPVFGVCLGHQALGIHNGLTLNNLSEVFHGRESTITHSKEGLFAEIPANLKVGKYHSWVVESANNSDEIGVTAKDEHGNIMAIQHKSRPHYGVQFHPESIMTEHGSKMIENFLNHVK